MATNQPTALNPLALYTEMLPSFGLAADEQGLISMRVGTDLLPVVVDEKRLVLPTPEIMRASQWATQQALHPIGESVVRGESAVIRKLKVLAVERFTSVFVDALVTIVKYAADSKTHAGLTPEQIAVFQCIPEADKKFANAVGKVIQVIDPSGPHSVIEIYLKRSPKANGVKYHRGAMISFPLVKELQTPGNKVYGVDMQSARNKQALLALVMSMVPNCHTPDLYNYYSDSATAPYFDALTHGFVGVMKPLNRLAWLFRSVPGVGECYADLDWIDNMSDLNLFRGILPEMEGNRGDLLSEPTGDVVATGAGAKPIPAHYAVNQPPQAVVAAPLPSVHHTPPTGPIHRAPAVGSGNSATDWMAFTAQRAQAAYHPPMFATTGGRAPSNQIPQQQPYGFPASPYPAPSSGVPRFATVGTGFQQPQQQTYASAPAYGHQPMQPVFV